MTSIIRRHPLVAFFVLAYALSWTPALFGPRSVFPFAPFLVALAVLAITGGRPALGDFLRRIVRWRVGLRWYALVLGLPPALTLGAVGLNVLSGAPSPTWSQMPGLASAVPTVVYFLVLIGLGEEPAWRGFALPRLMANRSWLAAAVVLGVLHALWHLPLLGTEYNRHQAVPWTFGVIAFSVVTAWMWQRTDGNLLLPMLFHTSVNTAALFLFNPLFDGAALDRLYWMWGGLWGAVAVATVVGSRVSSVRAPVAAGSRREAAPTY